MGQLIHAGRQIADDIARIQMESGSSLDAITDEVRRDIFYGAASEYATRMASTLPGVVVELLQKMFPRGLKFKDPSGSWHDARILFGNKNKHAGNNRSASDAVNSSSNSGPPPRMIDNLNLDYSAPYEVFKQAAFDPNSCGNVMPSIESKFLNKSNDWVELDNTLADELAIIEKTTSSKATKVKV